MLESEKSALVLENERQRAQYEEYLDEIANQVVQALMSQKVGIYYYFEISRYLILWVVP